MDNDDTKETNRMKTLINGLTVDNTEEAYGAQAEARQRARRWEETGERPPTEELFPTMAPEGCVEIDFTTTGTAYVDPETKTLVALDIDLMGGILYDDGPDAALLDEAFANENERS